MSRFECLSETALRIAMDDFQQLRLDLCAVSKCDLYVPIRSYRMNVRRFMVVREDHQPEVADPEAS